MKMTMVLAISVAINLSLASPAAPEEVKPAVAEGVRLTGLGP